jgi:hypothetical protein
VFAEQLPRGNLLHSSTWSVATLRAIAALTAIVQLQDTTDSSALLAAVAEAVFVLILLPVPRKVSSWVKVLIL